MSNAATNTDLIAHTKALEAAGITIKLVMRVPAPLKSIADQVIRSASSVPANLAEGHGRIGRDRSNHWRIAYASAKEVDSHLMLLAHAGAISQNQALDAINAFDQVRAMTSPAYLTECLLRATNHGVRSCFAALVTKPGEICRLAFAPPEAMIRARHVCRTGRCHCP